MTRGRRILFTTVDGILQPLGYSQVVRVAAGLARRGYEYDIVTLERPKDVARVEALEALHAELAALGIRWFPEPYDGSGGAKAAARNLGRLVARGLRQVATGDIALSHARSHLGAMPALAAHTVRRIPFIFDTRGRWIDERLEEGKWFTNPTAMRSARALERRMYGASVAVVTLTELEAGDVRSGAFGPAGHRPIVCIPTCADFDEFQIGGGEEWRFVPADLRARLEGRLVVAFVGAMNRSYLTEEGAKLARLILDRRADAFVVALTGQREEYSDLFSRHGIGKDRSLIAPVEHRAMPEWLSLVRWGVLLLESPPAKRGSMPTKLAEFFAAGVRPLQHGCNTEVSEWVRRAGSGYVLPDLGDAELRRAADFVCAAPPVDAELLLAARKATYAHFSLATGIERYVEILRQVMPG